MKSVFIVTDGDYSDYHIEAVFDNVKDAENYCYVHKLSASNIEEYTVNPTIEKLNLTPVKALKYYWEYNKKSSMKRDIGTDILFVEPKKIGTVEIDDCGGYIILTTYFDIDKDNVSIEYYHKVASDRFAPYLENMLNRMGEKL